MSTFAIHFDLREKRECDTIVNFAYLFYGFISFWFLVCELVAWKSENYEIIMRVCIPKSFELFKLWSESTFRRSIDDEDHFSSVLGKCYRFMIRFLKRYIVEGSHNNIVNRI